MYPSIVNPTSTARSAPSPRVAVPNLFLVSLCLTHFLHLTWQVSLHDCPHVGRRTPETSSLMDEVLMRRCCQRTDSSRSHRSRRSKRMTTKRTARRTRPYTLDRDAVDSSCTRRSELEMGVSSCTSGQPARQISALTFSTKRSRCAQSHK